MGLRAQIEEVLTEDGLTGRARLIPRSSDAPPFVVVRYAGLALDTVEPLINRHALDVWCVVQEDIGDPEDLARHVWGVLRKSRIVIPVLIVVSLSVRPPGSNKTHDAAIIRCAGIQSST